MESVKSFRVMKNQTEINIIDTFSYFDVFDYPLTLKELKLYLHYENLSKKVIKDKISDIPIIDNRLGYFFLKGREAIAVKRKMQEEISTRKRDIALNASLLLRRIPGVKLIGVSGSAAMNSSSENDDIDLFIITRRNTLWIVRAAVVILMKFFGIKREYKSKDNKNKFCLNMFLDEKYMDLSDKKSLYSAHEIVQLKVLYDKGSTFNKFIENNHWINSYFPTISIKDKKNKTDKGQLESTLNNNKITKGINLILFTLQFLYMYRKKTNEKVLYGKALFHPIDKSGYVMQEYGKRRSYYILLYNKLSDSKSCGFYSDYYKKLKLHN